MTVSRRVQLLVDELLLALDLTMEQGQIVLHFSEGRVQCLERRETFRLTAKPVDIVEHSA